MITLKQEARFLPTTPEEIHNLGISRLDVIIVSGDVYIDSYFDGAAVIGRVLEREGFSVGIIAQPDIHNSDDIMRLGEPRLFWGVTAGCVDSMVANYTSLKKKKKFDDLTPEGQFFLRPDRATIIYTNLIKRYAKSRKPIILGGIEASLRRIAHYDYWSDSIRRAVLLDAKADALVYGMGEKTIINITRNIENGIDYKDVKGICYISGNKPDSYIELPSYEEVKHDKYKFIQMFHAFYSNNEPLSAKGLVQKYGDRWLIQNPPMDYPTSEELDKFHSLNYLRDVHPFYKKKGKIKALDTIQFSVNSHRNCYGECNFCAITVHQGKTILSRTEESIIKEIESFRKHPDFKGIISDIGGPTANMYGNGCKLQSKSGSCSDKRCSYPEICLAMNINHDRQVRLLRKINQINGIKKAFIGSGIRYDLIIADSKSGKEYLVDVVNNHISGQMKIAPEHTDEKVLTLMSKPSNKNLVKFKKEFSLINKEASKKQFLTYYFIAAHPGCGFDEMNSLNKFIHEELKLQPEQVQIFNPTPSTYSTLMYYTEMDPWTLEKIYVEKELRAKSEQKNLIVRKRTMRK